MESAELQNAHNAAEERNRVLRRDNLDLKLLIVRLSQQIQDLGPKPEDQRKMRSALEKSTEMLTRLQSWRTALEANISDLSNELESRLGEMSMLKRIRKTDREQIQNLSSCISTLKHQKALGQNCVQQKDEEITQREAALEELSSAVQEHMELVEVLHERTTDLQVEIIRAPEPTEEILTSFGTCQNRGLGKAPRLGKPARPLSFYEELSLCKGEQAPERSSMDSKTVSFFS